MNPINGTKDIFDLSLIFSVFSYILKFKGQKNLLSENFVNLLETLVTLKSKWPGISKIYQPILDYRMVCVLRNDLLVFDTSHGTPCTYIPTYLPTSLLSLELLSSSLFSFDF